MQPDAAKYLHDMRQAIGSILGYVEGKTIEAYFGDRMLRSAVERELGILGEAMTSVARIDPDTAAGIHQAGRIIGLRNILIHAYFRVDNNIVWDIVQHSISPLRLEIEALLRDASE